MNIRRQVSRSSRLLLLLGLFFCLYGEARADFFPRKSFQPYTANGYYPFWSEGWVALERRVFVDAQGIPYVMYETGKSYNTTTISLFALRAYDRFLEHGRARDKDEFLHLANWIATNQTETCGCWYHDFDFIYPLLNETIHKPWTSAMTQGLAISVMARAYVVTHEARYLETAERGLLPFSRKVEQRGVARSLWIFANAEENTATQFYEEYPTEPHPTYTLNGFMFSLIGLYDLSRLPNARAEALFQQGLRGLRIVVPHYDLGDGSSYDLVHLTSPPHPVHRDVGYHLVHITLLNALGSATGDSRLLWYRDQWNSYGMPLQASGLWLEHFGVWLLFRETIPFLLVVLIFMVACLKGFRFLWLLNGKRQRSRRSLIRASLVANGG